MKGAGQETAKADAHDHEHHLPVPTVEAVPAASTPRGVGLRRALGNQVVGRVLEGRTAARADPGPTFELEASGSDAEQEAVRMAATAGSSLAPPSPPDGRGSPGRAGRRLSDGDAEVVARALTSGSRLPPDLGARLEGQFARHLGDVRVHRGPAADAATARLDTRAFTVGHDIVLGAGAPAAGSAAGLRLLAHEVAHVLQGSPGIVPGRAHRIRRQERSDGVSDGTGVAPVADEEPVAGLDIRRAGPRNRAWWGLLELGEVRPLGATTPLTSPGTYANRVLAIQRASRAEHLRALTEGRALTADGILGPRTLWFLYTLATQHGVAGDRQQFIDLGVDLTAVAGAASAALTAYAAIHRPLVAARWTYRQQADPLLRYYRQHYAINRNDADLLDPVLFGGPAPPDVTRDDRHELLAQVYGGQTLPGIGALVSVDRRYLHRVDNTYVVEHGPRAGGRWSPYFAFRIHNQGAADEAVTQLGIDLPAGHRARQVRERLGEPGPPLSGLLVSVDIPAVDPATRQTIVEGYLAQQRRAREEAREEAEANNRLAARQRADRFLELAGHRRDLEFTLDLQRLMRDFTGQPAFFFEYFLDDLNGREPSQLDAFFDAVEGVRAFVVHAPVIRLALGTRYAEHARVRRSVEVLNARRQGVIRSRFQADGVRLGGADGPLLRVGEVAGSKSTLWLRDESMDRIKPARMAELAEVAQEKAKDIFAAVLSGEDQRSLSQEQIAAEAFEQAAKAIGLKEEDLERDVDYEESVKLLSIRQVTEDGLERSYLTWQVVERWGGSGAWTPVENGQESGDDLAFDLRLDFYRISQTTDVLLGIAAGMMLVGAIAVAWEAGLAGLLLRAAGGTGSVITSIVISEVVYVATSYWRGERLTVSGFLFAALDGYLAALAFHRFAPLGRLITARFATGPTIVMRRLVAGWLLSRAATGAAAGAVTGPAALFVRDLVGVLSGDRSQFSSLGDYLTQLGYGALLGAAFEIAGSAVFASLRGQGPTALARAADVAAAVQARGINPRAWLAESAGVLSRLRMWALLNLHGDLAQVVIREVSARLVTVARAVAAGGRTAHTRIRADVLRQVMDVAEVELTRDATAGLERMLTVGQAGGRAVSNDVAIEVLRLLRANPERTGAFLTLMKDLHTPVLDDLIARGALGQLADAPAALAMSGRLGPVGTGELLRDVFPGSVRDLDGFAAGVAGLDEAAARTAWDALQNHRQLLAAVSGRGAVTPTRVAAIGRFTGEAGVDLPGLRDMLAQFDAPQTRGFLDDVAAAPPRRLQSLAELTTQGRDGARRYLQRLRLAGPGRVPAGPDATVVPPAAAPPVPPTRNLAPGARETAMRALVPADDQVGFDIFMERLRAGGADVEVVLAGRTQAQVDAVAAARAREFRTAEQAARAHAHARDNPLDPQLRHTEQVGDVTIRYEGIAAAPVGSPHPGGRPDPGEIAQAQAVATATHEPVEIFGDTMLGRNYPGIDGVIGRPPRPLSLKRSNGAGTTQFAPVHAQDALESAAAAGYSRVEVHIHMNDSTVAQIRAELAHPTHHRANRPMFDARDTIAKYVFHGTDGTFTLEPPL